MNGNVDRISMPACIGESRKPWAWTPPGPQQSSPEIHDACDDIFGARRSNSFQLVRLVAPCSSKCELFPAAPARNYQSGSRKEGAIWWVWKDKVWRSIRAHDDLKPKSPHPCLKLCGEPQTCATLPHGSPSRIKCDMSFQPTLAIHGFHGMRPRASCVRPLTSLPCRRFMKRRLSALFSSTSWLNHG